MTRYLAVILLVLVLAGRAAATDLAIDKIIVKKHPVPTPYFVYVRATASGEEAIYHPHNKPFGFRHTGDSPIEIPLSLHLKNVQLHSWVPLTFHLDTDDSRVATHNALKKHTGRIQVLSGTHSSLFIPELHNNPFMYEVFYHTVN